MTTSRPTLHISDFALEYHLGYFLAINGSGTHNCGFAGKGSACLSLFELSREFNDSKFEDYAFKLLQESLLTNNKSVSFLAGLTGVGYTLCYLINNRFISDDFEEFFDSKHELIINSLSLPNAKVTAAELYYFVEYFRLRGKIPSFINQLIRNSFDSNSLKKSHHTVLMLQSIIKELNLTGFNHILDVEIELSNQLQSRFLSEYNKYPKTAKTEEIINSTLKGYPVSKFRKISMLLLDLISERNNRPKRIEELIMIT
ncbi:MAG: hypothetical protein R3Y04_06810 [Rikenellaceae bacterium]